MTSENFDEPEVSISKLMVANERFLGRLFMAHGSPPATSKVVPLPTRLTTSKSNVKPLISDVIRAACDFYDVTQEDVTSEQRRKPVVQARMAVYHLAPSMTGHSGAMVARRLNRDPSTALEGANSIKRMLLKNARLADELDVIRLRAIELALSRMVAA